MAKLLKLRRGTTSQHSSFTGAEGEVTVDTTKDTLVVHDGSTAGGHPISKESANLSLIDEDNMATNSASRPPSQQSVKAYVDAGDLSLIDEDNMSTNSATRPPSQQSVKAYVDAHIIDEDNMASDSATKPPSQQSVKAYAAKLSTSEGTVGSSETVIVDADKDITGFRNVTLTGELDAATGDFSGNVDIDGTLEADAITVNSVTLSNYVKAAVGEMVTGNTETGITVTYENSDNTLDFVTSGAASEATEVTVAANNSTDETVYPTFVDGATGAQGIETDTGLTYNPSTGLITAVGLTLSGNLTVGGTTTTINSTTLTVDDKNIELGSVNTPSDTTADGGGITLKGASDKEIKWINSTDSWTFNQDIEVTSGGVKITGIEGGHATLSLNADEADDNADQWRVMAGSGGAFTIGSYSTGSWINTLTIDGSGIVTGHSNVVAGGTVSDSKGNLRSIPQITSLSSSHTLATGDTGKHILTNSQTIVVPNSTFAAGDAITLVNNGSSATTLTKNISNLYNPTDGTTPTALAAKGMCTILFVSGTEAYITGGGLS